MDKYKLQKLVTSGSYSRRAVDSDVIVGDIKNGYEYGDILDANATKSVASNIAEDKANAVRLELISLIQSTEVNPNSLAGLLRLIEDIRRKNDQLDEQDVIILQLIENIIGLIHNNTPTIGGNNDNLIFS